MSLGPYKVGKGAFYLLLWAFGAWFLYLRYPAAYDVPNFFAEDGFFAVKLKELGFWRALFLRPSPQFTMGLIVLAQIAKFIVILFFHSDFSEFPRAFALISYFFISGLAVFSIIVFRPFLARGFLALLYTSQLVALYAPNDDLMTGSLIGTRYLCLYLAFLLVLYFEKIAETAWECLGCAFLLALCVNTYQSVYCLLPITWFNRFKNSGTPYSRDPRFWGTLLTGLLALPQALLILKRGPRIAGYLDGPYQWAQTIHLFLFEGGVRALVVGWGVGGDNFWLVVLSLLLSVAFLVLADRKKKEIYLTGAVTLFFGTLFIVVARPQISHARVHQVHWPFFDSQSLIIVSLFILLMNDAAARFPKTKFAAYAVVWLLLLQMTEYHRKFAAPSTGRSPVSFPEQVSYLCAGRQEDRTYYFPNPPQYSSFWVFRPILCPDSERLPLQPKAKRFRH